MKRWISASLALLTFISVTTLAVTALFSVFTHSTSAATVTYAPTINTLNSANTSNFNSYATYFKSRGISLLSNSDAPLAQASWNAAIEDSPTTLEAAHMLKTEWLKYSQANIANSGLKKIYFVTNLIVDGQHRSGMPEAHYQQALYFDVSSTYVTSEDGVYMSRVFHHEFNHLMQYDLYGSYTPNDTVWQKCNSSDFIYGNGGPSMYTNPSFAHVIHPQYGFVNGYSTSGQDEDKAEVFADYMTNPGKLQQLASTDEGVDCKLRATQAFLQHL